MIDKKYTTLHYRDFLNNGKPTPIIPLREEDGSRWYAEHRDPDMLYYDDCPIKIATPPFYYVAGEAANRLYEYEQLGYSPLELKNMIQKTEVLQRMLNSTYGKFASVKLDMRAHIDAVVDKAMSKKDRQVTIMFDDSGKPVISICPYSEEIEK